MAQKTQTAPQSEDQANSGSRTSSAKDGTGPGSPNSARQSISSGAVSSSTLPRISDPTPNSTSTKSESPQPPPQAMEKPSSAAGSQPSPYGTRSRNRTGAARPNYAEDKDLDLDIFDAYPQRKEDDPKKSGSTKQQGASSTPTPANSSQTGAPRSGNGSSRKPLPDEGRQQNGIKDQQNQSQRQSPAAALSSSIVNGTTTTTTTTTTTSTANGSSKGKKRKVADTASTASGSQTPLGPNGSLSSSVLQKRLGTAGQGSGDGTPSVAGYGETNLLTFDNCKARPKNGKMIADDGTVLEVNDHVYLVCEPPGEPYYLGRIMEFMHIKNDPTLPIDALRINWYYRPKDIGRKVQDTRLVFATMHSDISPLTSLRGKCQIRHKAEIEDMAAYKRTPDCFWYEKLYDRYIQKNYEVIPTRQVINVPEHVKKVLDERWKYVLTEQGRGKELTSAVKTCKRCTTYCANNDSVDCAVCQNTYHMNCVKPPLLKKPSRGFAWSCAACSRAQERKLEARHTPNISDSRHHDVEDDEALDDEDEEMGGVDGADTGRTSRTSPAEENPHPSPTAEQIYHASLWPYRYFGMHCKVEDALDLDDRIFPRASTRLGLRHQAIVPPWFGRPVQYVKPLEFKKSGKSNSKLTKEQQAALEAERIEKEKRPKWIQDEPPGYIERGGDDTSTLLFKPPEDCGVSMSSEALDDYMNTARSMAVSLGLPPRSTNLQDVARDLLFRNGFDPKKALAELVKVPKADFGEPELTPAEQKKFEEAVAKYGSELHSVKKHVKTLSAATITRYYYTWKKTERGQHVWGNFSGRKGKKDAKKAEAAANKLADDVADPHDDSAFDADKALERKKSFMCKFCGTKKSRKWRRAPAAAVTPVTENGGKNANKEKKEQYIQALCRRCAELWRRYAIQWEDVDELAKKVAQTGGRGWRRRVDEDLYRELLAVDEMVNSTRYPTPDEDATATPASSLNGQATAAAAAATTMEPPRKKLKSSLLDKEKEKTPSESGSATGGPPSKKKEKTEKQQSQAPAPPPVPEIPKPKTLPCAICREMEPLGDQHLSCRECRLTVHRNCYGVVDNRAPGKWTCDMCINDKNPQLSIHYKCVLCPIEYTAHDFVEQPKVSNSHKKKTEKERERERIERENAQRAADYYRKKQEEMNRPVNPREPLKRTADNNWVHVTCAVFTPEVKFGNARALSPSEGIPLIPRASYAEVCKVCKKSYGACVECRHCRNPVHVECAHQAGYILGFEVTPVKGSRRDQSRIVTINGNTGAMSAGVWCKEHLPTKTTVYRMNETVAESGGNVLQLFVQNCKQADLTLTGCARKANQITVASKMSTSPTSATSHHHRRASLVTAVHGDHEDAPSSSLQPGGKICLTCGIDVSPKWHPIDQVQEKGLTNGYYGNIGSEAQKFVEQRSFQCHKCKKAGRQPTLHSLPPREPTPPPEPARQTSQAASAILPPRVDEPRHSSRGPYGWPPAPGPSSGVQAPILQAPAPGPMAHPVGPPVQAPPVAPPPLPPTIAPRAPPVQPPAPYAPPRPYDWHRPSASHGPPPLHPSREVNGGPSPPPSSMPPLAPPNHLRPPPISIPHSTAQSPPNGHGHMVQPPFVNGVQHPPSPRRSSGPPPPPPNGPPPGPYHPHHGHPPPDLRPHHMPPINPMPPVGMAHSAGAEAPPPPNYLRQWGSHHQSHHPHGPPPPHHHHGSPPPPGPPPIRDGPPSMGHHESGMQPHPPPAQHQQPQHGQHRENRPASGASASPSLRNLLS